MGSSSEAARKAIEEAAKLREQSGQSQGIGSAGLKKLSKVLQQQSHASCGTEAESKWRAREEQKTESQGSENKMLGKGGI